MPATTMIDTKPTSNGHATATVQTAKSKRTVDASQRRAEIVRRVSWTGTHHGPLLGIAPTGRRVRGEGTVAMRIADGQIAEEWEMSNLLGLLQRLSAVPSFPLDQQLRS
jgi:hypothetical protein